MPYLPTPLIELVTVVFIASYVWVIVAHTLVFAFLGFWRVVFGFIGEKSYTLFLLLIFLASLAVSYAQSPVLLSQKAGFPTPISAVGLLFFVAGGLADLWSSRTLGWKAIMNAPSMMKSQGRKLVKTGPYAFSRNPLYAADFVIITGFYLLTGYDILLPIAVLYAASTMAWARLEEKELEEIFGEEYREYARRVPRFI